MNKTRLAKILKLHSLWLKEKPRGKRADLSKADLSGADLSEADLFRADLFKANLSGADLSKADLSGADLSKADLSGADLSGADLSEADLSEADLSGADLSGADLSEADLSGADLSEADLSGAALSGAALSGAALSEANLSGAKGLLDVAKWLYEHFDQDKEGVLVYKTFGQIYIPPRGWKTRAGEVIEEEVNPNRTEDCGCGVNFSTLAWQKHRKHIWLCRIAWMDLAGVIVPYNTDGKARCRRLTLLKKVKR